MPRNKDRRNIGSERGDFETGNVASDQHHTVNLPTEQRAERVQLLVTLPLAVNENRRIAGFVQSGNHALCNRVVKRAPHRLCQHTNRHGPPARQTARDSARLKAEAICGVNNRAVFVRVHFRGAVQHAGDCTFGDSGNPSDILNGDFIHLSGSETAF